MRMCKSTSHIANCLHCNNYNHLLATLRFMYFTIFRQISHVIVNIIPT